MNYSQRPYRATPMPDKGAAFGACLGAIVLMFVIPLLLAWWGMLLAGILHHEVSEKIPAFGYWQVFWIVLALSFISSVVRGVSTSKGNN